MRLVIYDLSGIQSFIFATNKLKEIIGASMIVSQGLFDNVPALLGEEADDWTKRSSVGLEDGQDAQVVYIGGGNAMVLYKDAETEKAMTRQLSLQIFEQSGGAIKLCSAGIEAQTDKSLSENQRQLMDKLDQNKLCTPQLVTVRGLAVDVQDNITYEPVLLQPDGTYAASGCYLKNSIYESSRNYRSKDKLPGYFRKISSDSLQYTLNFDSFEQREGKNYLAVIHIDGNTMGIRIRQFVDSLRDNNLLLELSKMSKLSQEINTVYQQALIAAVEKTYAAAADLARQTGEQTEITFRPVVVDGDDITVICDSAHAFPFVAAFMQELKTASFSSLADYKITAAAGIAFVKSGFPFYTAYGVAEQCCKNAKAVTLQRCLGQAACSVDFQICYSGVTRSLKQFREINYCKRYEGRQYKLHLRPYFFDFGTAAGAAASEPIVSADLFDYEKSFIKKLQDLGIIRSAAPQYTDRTKDFARSKLKGLRNAYGSSVLSAVMYGDFMQARFYRDEMQEAAELLSQPFYEPVSEDNQDVYYARFFDVLDVMDLWAEEPVKEVVADE